MNCNNKRFPSYAGSAIISHMRAAPFVLFIVALLNPFGSSRADELPARISISELDRIAPERESVHGPIEALLVTRTERPISRPVIDPVNGVRFDAACHVYVLDHGQYDRRFIVHVESPAHLSLAKRA